LLYLGQVAVVNENLFSTGLPGEIKNCTKITLLLADWKEVGVYSIAYEFSEGSLAAGPFSPPLHAIHGYLGLFPRSSISFASASSESLKEKSNRSPDVQKLFSLIRVGRGNIMYKVSF
jgi:hypothetical protein